jgi:FtsZ-binding cell division protein ZapB
VVQRTIDTDSIKTLVSTIQSLRISVEDKDSKITDLGGKNGELQLQIDDLKQKNDDLIDQMNGLKTAIEHLSQTFNFGK